MGFLPAWMIAPLSVCLIATLACYLIALMLLVTRWVIPQHAGPPVYETRAALLLVSAQEVVGSSVATLQMPLIGLSVLACGYALIALLRQVVQVRHMLPEERRQVQQWAAVIAPSYVSLALLALRHTLPDTLAPDIFDLFLLINLVPACYLIVRLILWLPQRLRRAA